MIRIQNHFYEISFPVLTLINKTLIAIVYASATIKQLLSNPFNGAFEVSHDSNTKDCKEQLALARTASTITIQSLLQ